MTNASESSPAVKPYWKSCPCPDCVSNREANALAARLGMADADPAVDPDTIAWQQVAPYHIPLPTEGPAEAEAAGPSRDDDAWRLETFELEGGCREWDLSPEEEEIELYGETAWKRAVREMEESEAERRYDRMVEMWGPAGEAW